MTMGVRVFIIVLMIIAFAVGSCHYITVGFQPHITLPLIAAILLGALLLTIKDKME